ncbi:MAG TPA: serine/threonine-protein kinase [Kofleriaceae bacterium]|nr:serine/threonine-protein kinase [Kofleriaceae bacterium]
MGNGLIGSTVLGRYQIEKELGKGSMGTVYRGIDLQRQREVAVKVMRDDLVHERKLLDRFKREARVAAKMQHPNLMRVLDAGETRDGRPVMVLELARGTTLTTLLEVSPAPRRVVRLVEQILLGLEHAHAAGLIHRDLKPDNVMVELGPDGTEILRIVDFGIAILRMRDGGIEGGRLTETGQIVGTPLYMAPELAKEEPYDHRVDLFALGVIMYEMLAGTVPFHGKTPVDIQLAYISKDPPPISTYVADVDPLHEAFTRKLMARKVAQRFASASEALRVLRLLETDPRYALLCMGIADTETASGVIGLRDPRRR